MEIIIGLVIIVVVVFIIRAFGAWMLRIDEVIDIQKEILKELKKKNEISKQPTSTPSKFKLCKNCGTVIQPNENKCSKCGNAIEK